MKNEIEFWPFSVCRIWKGDQWQYYAFMLERMFYSDRFMYFMDETGHHEFIHESNVYAYKFIGRAKYSDANSICILLRALNDLQPAYENNYIDNFNSVMK